MTLTHSSLNLSNSFLMIKILASSYTKFCYHSLCKLAFFFYIFLNKEYMLIAIGWAEFTAQSLASVEGIQVNMGVINLPVIVYPFNIKKYPSWDLHFLPFTKAASVKATN